MIKVGNAHGFIVAWVKAILADEDVVFDGKVKEWLAFTNMKRGLSYLNGHSANWIRNRFYEYLASGIY